MLDALLSKYNAEGECCAFNGLQETRISIEIRVSETLHRKNMSLKKLIVNGISEKPNFSYDGQNKLKKKFINLTYFQIVTELEGSDRQVDSR